MNENIKRGVTTILGGSGVIVLLLGVFGFIRFEVGLIIAIAIWIATGAISTMLGISKKNEEQSYQPRRRGWLWSLVIGLLLILGGLFLLSFAFNRGSGNVVTRTRDVKNFDKVNLSGTGKINFIQGEEEGLTISAEENIIDKITTNVLDNTLIIAQKYWWFNIWPTKDIVYEVKIKNLSDLELNGSAEAKSDNLSGNDLNINISGSGKLQLKLKYTNLKINISGSGEMNIAGEVDVQEIEISGSGQASNRDLNSKNTKVSISGSGKAVVNAQEKLDVRISGSGNIKYLGNPSISQNISGSGSIEKIE
jgi:hypothetical protein